MKIALWKMRSCLLTSFRWFYTSMDNWKTGGRAKIYRYCWWIWHYLLCCLHILESISCKVRCCPCSTVAPSINRNSNFPETFCKAFETNRIMHERPVDCVELARNFQNFICKDFICIPIGSSTTEQNTSSQIRDGLVFLLIVNGNWYDVKLIVFNVQKISIKWILPYRLLSCRIMVWANIMANGCTPLYILENAWPLQGTMPELYCLVFIFSVLAVPETIPNLSSFYFEERRYSSHYHEFIPIIIEQKIWDSLDVLLMAIIP